jgi:hypothetical protein
MFFYEMDFFIDKRIYVFYSLNILFPLIVIKELVSQKKVFFNPSAVANLYLIYYLCKNIVCWLSK